MGPFADLKLYDFSADLEKVEIQTFVNVETNQDKVMIDWKSLLLSLVAVATLVLECQLGKVQASVHKFYDMDIPPSSPSPRRVSECQPGGQVLDADRVLYGLFLQCVPRLWCEALEEHRRGSFVFLLAGEWRRCSRRTTA